MCMLSKAGDMPAVLSQEEASLDSPAAFMGSGWEQKAEHPATFF